MGDFIMVKAGLILVFTLVIFALGKSPVFRVDRAGAAIVGAALMIGLGVLSFDQAVQSIDYRTIILLFAMMIVVANLKLSGFFNIVGSIMIRGLKTRKQLLFGIIMISGLLSAFFINDIVCLLFTPIVIMICRRAEITPVPYLLGVATASNIGSAGTLLGNPQNILIGSIARLPFLTYLISAFPIALIGLLINYLFISWFYRRELKGILEVKELPEGVVHRYLIIKSLIVTIGILVGFLVRVEPAVIALWGAAYLLITRRVKPNKIYASIDFNLLIIFAGLFVVIAGVERSGILVWIFKEQHFLNLRSFTVFSILTVVLSNVISNVPAVMLLKSFIPTIGGNTWWIGLGVFSTIAGNLTLTGSIANLIVAETAKREGITIGYKDYVKLGFPLTVILIMLISVYFTYLG